MIKKLFNLWRRFDKYKPDKDGWYECTVNVGDHQRYVMQLYYRTNTKKFIDNIRYDMLRSYYVYNEDPYSYYIQNCLKVSSIWKLQSTRICNLDCIDRTKDVVAWKKIPRTYLRGGYKNEKFYSI